MPISNKILHMITGCLGGLLVALLFNFIYIALYIKGIACFYSNEFFHFCLLNLIVFSLTGVIAGVLYFCRKQTHSIWLLTYLLLYVTPILLEPINDKITSFGYITLYSMISYLCAI